MDKDFFQLHVIRHRPVETGGRRRVVRGIGRRLCNGGNIRRLGRRRNIVVVGHGDISAQRKHRLHIAGQIHRARVEIERGSRC